jgi:hypothetical protein
MIDEQELQRFAERYGPLDPIDFVCNGGMGSIEAKAVAEALADVRRRWLPRLEEWLAEAMAGKWATDETGDLLVLANLESAVTQLRIRLGIKVVDIEKRRRQTRERVRRHRARLTNQ